MSILSQICDYIILISAVLGAIAAIAQRQGRPLKWFKTKREEEIKKVLNSTLPAILEENNAKLKASLDKQITETVQAQIQPIKDEIHILSEASKDMLREKIMEIYYKNVDDKTLTIYEKGALELQQKDYMSEGGNSYIPRFLEEMKKWDVIDR